MVMDCARSLSLCPARILHRPSKRVFWVRWFWAAEGAKVFPHPNAFGAPWFESQPTVWPDGVGIKWQPGNWRSRNYPAPPGQHFLGDPTWFADGMPESALADRPIAATCAGLAIDAMGGPIIGGTGWSVFVGSTVRLGLVPSSTLVAGVTCLGAILVVGLDEISVFSAFPAVSVGWIVVGPNVYPGTTITGVFSGTARIVFTPAASAPTAAETFFFYPP